MTREVTPEDHRLIDRALASRGGHLGIGHAGFHLEWEGGWLSGYRCDEMKEACIARGLPVVDNRRVPFGALARIVIGGPMVAVGRPADPPPWHALSYAPLAVVATACRAAGADIRNIPDADLEAAARALDGSITIKTARETTS
jgi:hypothetical protein